MNDEVTATAAPAAGYAFTAWTGDCLGTVGNVCTLTMDGPKSVSATFTQIEYTLVVSIDPVGSGTVTRSNYGPYHLNDTVTLTATAEAGYVFSVWTDDCLGTVGNVCTLTMDGP